MWQGEANPTYPANLCPIYCGGAATYSRPRTIILHNEDGDCKSFLETWPPPAREPARCGLRGSPPVRQNRTKRKRSAYSSDLERSVERTTPINYWPVYIHFTARYRRQRRLGGLGRCGIYQVDQWNFSIVRDRRLGCVGRLDQHGFQRDLAPHGEYL